MNKRRQDGASLDLQMIHSNKSSLTLYSYSVLSSWLQQKNNVRSHFHVPPSIYLIGGHVSQDRSFFGAPIFKVA